MALLWGTSVLLTLLRASALAASVVGRAVALLTLSRLSVALLTIGSVIASGGANVARVDIAAALLIVGALSRPLISALAGPLLATAISLSLAGRERRAVCGALLLCGLRCRSCLLSRGLRRCCLRRHRCRSRRLCCCDGCRRSLLGRFFSFFGWRVALAFLERREVDYRTYFCLCRRGIRICGSLCRLACHLCGALRALCRCRGILFGRLRCRAWYLLLWRRGSDLCWELFCCRSFVVNRLYGLG